MFAPAARLCSGVSGSAASFSDINTPSVFFKQHTSVTCTLSSAAMIMRRTAIIAGYSDWEEITENNIRKAGWVDGVGLLWNFTAYNMTIGHGYFSGTDNKAEMIALLAEYPQGIVIYNGGNGGQSHAIILTDYDEASDTFYTADPSSAAPWGRIKMTDSTILGKTQQEQIRNLTSYWFVSSPSVKLENGVYSISGSGSAPGGFGNGQGSYNPESDAALFDASKSAENTYYVVSEDTSKGIALRYYPSGSSDAVKYVHKGTILYVTYTGRNNFGAKWAKTSDGYYIFTGNIMTFEKYSAEVVKFNNTEKSAQGTYIVKSASGEKTALRLEPSEGNNIIGYADNQSKIYITHSGVNSVGALWLRTEEGYYIKASEAVFVSASKQQDAAFSGEVLPVTGKYSSKPVPDDTSIGAEFPIRFRITASALNLRKSPVNGEVILAIPRNEIVYVTEISDGWGKTEYNGQTGWISLDYAIKIGDRDVLSIESMKLSSDRLETGQTVVCTVTLAENNNGLYLFSVYNDSGEAVCTAESYKAANSFSYKTEKAGNYYFKVDVVDSSGNVVSGYSGNFTVYDKLQINAVMSNVDEYTYIYEPISWTVDAADTSSEVVYCYSLFLGDELVYEESSPNNELNYKPEKMGEYVLKVRLSDGISFSDEVQANAVIVYDMLSISAIRLNTTSLLIGSEIICSVSATGGTGSYSYCFSVFKDNELIKSGSFSSSPEYHHTFTELGKYSIFCSVTDSGNMIVSAFSAEITVASYLHGDADLDGKVTSSDARLALRHSSGLHRLSDDGIRAADMNNDGRITASDARAILRVAAKLD